MTCASCAARIEKKLNGMAGVTATVNFATEKAKVTFADTVAPEDLVATVEATGYTATLPEESHAGGEATPPSEPDEAEPWRQRLTVSTVLTVPVVLLSMIPALQFDNWQWLALTLASPVVVWGALPFHRAAWTNLRHGAATMDTLISVGVIAAYLWSLWALFFTHAGMTGMKMSFDLLSTRQRRTPHLPRSRFSGNHFHPRRPLLRSPREAAIRGGAARPAEPGRERRGGAARRIDRDAYPDQPTRRR